MSRMRSKNDIWVRPGIAITVVIIMTGTFFVFTPQTATAIIPAEIPNYRTGVASFYSYECADQPMANGRIFDPEDRTCASWFHEFGTVLIVKSLDTGRSTEVVVTDRGPNKRLVREGRIIDLSKRAFEDICDLDKGLTRVEIQVKAN